jgi:hypothetical protein
LCEEFFLSFKKGASEIKVGSFECVSENFRIRMCK